MQASEGEIAFVLDDEDFLKLSMDWEDEWPSGATRPRIRVGAHEKADSRETLVWLDPPEARLFAKTMLAMADEMGRMMGAAEASAAARSAVGTSGRSGNGDGAA